MKQQQRWIRFQHGGQARFGTLDGTIVDEYQGDMFDRPTPTGAQLTLSAFFFGFGGGQLIYGPIADRFGRLPVIAAGALMLIFAVGLAGIAPGTEAVPVILALFLNGVGWNLAFVAGSALLTDALAPVERASVQGLADLLMGLMGAIGSAAGGMILGLWGFAILNAVGAVLVGGGELHETFDSLVRTERPLSRGIQRFTGISQAMIDAAPPPDDRNAAVQMLKVTELLKASIAINAPRIVLVSDS